MVEEIRAAGEAVAVADTVTTMEGGERIVQTAIDAFGKIDGVVCGPATCASGCSSTCRRTSGTRSSRPTLKGTFTVFRAAARTWASGPGQLHRLHPGALTGASPRPTTPRPAGAIVSLVKSVAAGMHRYNVTANAIAPSLAPARPENARWSWTWARPRTSRLMVVYLPRTRPRRSPARSTPPTAAPSPCGTSPGGARDGTGAGPRGDRGPLRRGRRRAAALIAQIEERRKARRQRREAERGRRGGGAPRCRRASGSTRSPVRSAIRVVAGGRRRDRHPQPDHARRASRGGRLGAFGQTFLALALDEEQGHPGRVIPGRDNPIHRMTLVNSPCRRTPAPRARATTGRPLAAGRHPLGRALPSADGRIYNGYPADGIDEAGPAAAASTASPA